MVFNSFIGIDVSKLTIDVHLAFEKDIQNGVHKVFKNTIKGFNTMTSFLKKKGTELENSLFCLENTGDYSLMLSHFLGENKHHYHLANPLTVKLSKGLLREKTDKVDAQMLMMYAYLKRDLIEESTLPSLHILKLRNLITWRKRLVKGKTSQQQYIKILLQTNDLVGNHSIIDLSEQQLVLIKKQIKAVEKEMQEIIAEHESLQKNHDLIRSIPGVGPILAVNLLITTRNFTCFENGRKYASYCGVAPFANSSGTSIRGRTKTSSICNKYIKALLTNCVTSLISHDKGIKGYYMRKLEEGKQHFVIVNNIRAKLINRIFSVIKRQEPYVMLNFS